ncbi:ATP-binding protein [Saccharothrix hoggarensis]|uniref:ATP-binding protein n=1 Tax=Saccharothrix hoggarensis TaxID=913853 RepID=A0ABW3QX68_9PSEU
MALLGYRDAFEELARSYDRSSAGRGELVLVSGGPASGKTELLHDFFAVAEAAGALLLSATGSRAEQSLQAGVVDQLFRGAGLPPEVGDRVSRLVVPQAPAADDGQSDVRSVRSAGARVVHEICGILLGLSREQPVVVGIDDVQFADTSSLEFVLYLRRRLGSARVLLVLSEWEQPQPTLPLFTAEVTRRPHHRIRLAPLSVADIVEVLPRSVEPVVASRLAEACHGLSGGNPMLVRALVEDLEHDPSVVAGGFEGGVWPAVGTAFRHAVLACLHRWEAALLDVARALAVLGDGSEPALLGRLAGVAPEDARRVVVILSSAGLLRDGWFRHAAAAEAVLEGMAGPQRAALHARAADLLHQRGAEPAVIARHLVAAHRGVGAWSVRVLRDAAEQALMRDEVCEAVRFLELALEATDDEEQRLAITKVLVRALWRVNPLAAAVHMGPLRTAMAAGRLGERDAVTLVRHALWHGDEETAVMALDVLNSTPGLLDAQTAAELRIAHQWFRGMDRCAVPEVPAKAEDDPWVEAARALTSFWRGGGDPATAVASAEHVLRSCRLADMTLEVVATALLVLVHSDDNDRAAWWCGELTAQAVRVGAVTWQAVLGAISADIALRCGEPAEAADRARRALDLLAPQSWGVSIGYPLATLMLANAALGRDAEIEELLRLRVPDMMFRTAYGLRYLHARGQCHLVAQRLLAAVTDFQTCGRLVLEWQVDVPVLVPWRSDLAEANLRLGRSEVARELVFEQLRMPGLDSRTRGVSLRVLAAGSDEDDRPRLLRAAVASLHTAGDRVQLALAMRDLGEAYERAGDGVARVPDQGAGRRDAVVGRGAGKAAVAEGGAADDVLLDCAASVLSESEHRVADLAVLGYTNREISARLFITVSTVEQHLTRIYRKLGVRSRAELPRRLCADDLSACSP